MAAPLPAVPHALSLKVLRLQKAPLFVEQHATPHSENADSQLPISSLLALPTSFGTCSLGESFSSLIVANNESEQPVQNASLTIEMHTAQSKQVLVEIAREGDLLPGESMQTKAQFEIKEVGQHALVCTVTYSAGAITGASTTRSFRKSYKFVTQNPLSVKTKVHTSRSPLAALSDRQKETSYLEVQIQNMSKHPLSFSRMQFLPDVGVKSTDCNASDCLDFLYPSDVRQLLYICTSEDTLSGSVTELQKSGGLGKLDLEWRGPMGESGRLQTSTLARKSVLPTPHQAFELVVLDTPQAVQVGKPFDITCKIQHVSSQTSSMQDTTTRITSAINTRGSIEQQSLPSQLLRTSLDLPSRIASPFRPSSRNSNAADSTPTPILVASPEVQMIGPMFQSLRPVMPAGMSGRKLSRASVLSTTTDATNESNEPLASIVERAASRNNSRAPSEVGEEDQSGMEEEVWEDADFTLSFVALEEGLLNVSGIRLLLLEANGPRMVLEQAVIAQVWSST